MRRRCIAVVAWVLAAGLAGIVFATPAPVSAAPAPGRLAYANGSGLWTSASDGSDPRLIVPPSDGRIPSEPRWSHDATKIAYRFANDNYSEVRVVNADGSGGRSFQISQTAPFWSLDDSRLLYIDRGYDGGLAYFNVDGSGGGHLFSGIVGSEDYGGDFSPDGSRIAFTRNGGGIVRVFTVDADGTNLIRITDGGGRGDGDVRWSPDGNRLLFANTSEWSAQLRTVVVNADGTGRRTLRESAVPWGWSPDGNEILFQDQATTSLWRMRSDGSGAALQPTPNRPWSVDWAASAPVMTAIAAGGFHSLALGKDKWVRGHGYNGQGQVGTGAAPEVRVPSLVPGLRHGYSIASGVLHSVAVMDDATVRAWGYNVYGQLGDGTTTDQRQAVGVGGLSSMVAAAAGFYHSLAVRSDGTVWAWGWNAIGQLGDGTTTDRRRAIQVPGLTGVVAVAAGAYHSLALRSDGTVWAWGYNLQGELGTGSAHGFTPVPTRIPGLHGVTSLSAGFYHSLAIRSDGTVWGWGYNGFGQLGTGNTVDARSPLPVPHLGPAVSVAGGGLHSLAALRDGSVRAWGFNGVGQLGDGTLADSLLAVEVRHLGSVSRVSAGLIHSLALVSPGRTWGWGSNPFGEIGTGTASPTLLRARSRN